LRRLVKQWLSQQQRGAHRLGCWGTSRHHSLGVRLLAGTARRLVPAEALVEDGKVICSEGVSAGIDRAFDLGAKLTNEELLARRSSCLFQVRFSHRIG
jgi:hypothetical protein